MMQLTTHSLGMINGNHAVAWCKGLKSKGIFFVTDIQLDDSLVVAELIVIRHLLFSKKIFGQEIHVGSGILLSISSPLIKKLYRGKSTKTHLEPYAHFMRICLSGVTLSTTEDTDPMVPYVGDDVPMEFLSVRDSPTYGIIDTPILGKMRLTKHALEQYKERFRGGVIKNPVKSLIGRLKHPELKLQQLPSRTLRHKLRKYGSIDHLEVWHHENSQMFYVVVRNPVNQVGTLVTVYNRHPEYLD